RTTVKNRKRNAILRIYSSSEAETRTYEQTFSDRNSVSMQKLRPPSETTRVYCGPFPIRFSKHEDQRLRPHNRRLTCRRSRLPERIECRTSRRARGPERPS